MTAVERMFGSGKTNCFDEAYDVFNMLLYYRAGAKDELNWILFLNKNIKSFEYVDDNEEFSRIKKMSDVVDARRALHRVVVREYSRDMHLIVGWVVDELQRLVRRLNSGSCSVEDENVAPYSELAPFLTDSSRKWEKIIFRWGPYSHLERCNFGNYSSMDDSKWAHSLVY